MSLGLFSGGSGLNMHTLDASFDPMFPSSASGSIGAMNRGNNNGLEVLSPVPSSISPLPNHTSTFSFADSSTSLSTSNSVLDD